MTEVACEKGRKQRWEDARVHDDNEFKTDTIGNGQKMRLRWEWYDEDREHGNGGYTENGDPEGGDTATKERAEVDAIRQPQGSRGERYGDNIGSGSLGYTENVDP